eukprot:TRINITY_DN861_c0_g1_i5.p1 TRINITY_DN861_c0_g1~~TRINITY_DN861_c0_g1_i5.p1  ORF type:complete len:288 (+),score=41.42 TRINITY_DN861_c0_g1_i5:89-952(+)
MEPRYNPQSDPELLKAAKRLRVWLAILGLVTLVVFGLEIARDVVMNWWGTLYVVLGIWLVPVGLIGCRRLKQPALCVYAVFAIIWSFSTTSDFFYMIYFLTDVTWQDVLSQAAYNLLCAELAFLFIQGVLYFLTGVMALRLRKRLMLLHMMHSPRRDVEYHIVAVDPRTGMPLSTGGVVVAAAPPGVAANAPLKQGAAPPAYTTPTYPPPSYVPTDATYAAQPPPVSAYQATGYQAGAYPGAYPPAPYVAPAPYAGPAPAYTAAPADYPPAPAPVTPATGAGGEAPR